MDLYERARAVKAYRCEIKTRRRRRMRRNRRLPYMATPEASAIAQKRKRLVDTGATRADYSAVRGGDQAYVDFELRRRRRGLRHRSGKVRRFFRRLQREWPDPNDFMM